MVKEALIKFGFFISWVAFLFGLLGLPAHMDDNEMMFWLSMMLGGLCLVIPTTLSLIKTGYFQMLTWQPEKTMQVKDIQKSKDALTLVGIFFVATGCLPWVGLQMVFKNGLAHYGAIGELKGLIYIGV